MALGSAFLHASWSALVKQADDKFAVTQVLVLVGGVLFLPLLFWVEPPGGALWLYLALSLSIHSIYQILLVKSLELGDLTLVYPIIRGIGPLIVAIGGSLFLADALSPYKLAAIFALVAALFWFSTVGNWRDLANLPAKALGMACLTGFMVGSYTLVDGVAVRLPDDPLTMIAWSNVLFVPLYFSIGYARRGHGLARVMLKNWRIGVVAGVLANLGYLMILLAFRTGNLPEAAALREVSIVFAAIIGVLLMGERLSNLKWTALLCICAAATLVKALP